MTYIQTAHSITTESETTIEVEENEDGTCSLTLDPDVPNELSVLLTPDEREALRVILGGEAS